MKRGYLNRRDWDTINEKWTQPECLDSGKTYNHLELILALDEMEANGYGRFISCSTKEATTRFQILTETGNLISEEWVREKLPWED